MTVTMVNQQFDNANEYLCTFICNFWRCLKSVLMGVYVYVSTQPKNKVNKSNLGHCLNFKTQYHIPPSIKIKPQKNLEIPKMFSK